MKALFYVSVPCGISILSSFFPSVRQLLSIIVEKKTEPRESENSVE